METPSKSPEFLQIDDANTSHELIDGEVVIIHFTTGNYYSLTGSAADIWRQLEQPVQVDSLPGLFGQDAAANAKGIEEFVARLHDEGLVKEVDAGEALPQVAEGMAQYVPPVLNKYTDMQQLLLADPLHEVEDTGWPNTSAVA